jgi:hypothetical protein
MKDSIDAKKSNLHWPLEKQASSLSPIKERVTKKYDGRHSSTINEHMKP